MSEHNIPWMEPVYWGNEEKYVVDALKSSWISGGKYTDLFEGRFANYIGAKYALTTSNGTSALHLAYLGLGLVAGDEIIVPGYCFMAAANVAINIGLKPVFVDVDRDTWCLSPADVERKITSKTKAIIPVHTYGNVSDMTPIIELANRYGLFVIEDAAESLGSKYAGQQSGTIGDVGTFSFHATKTVTTGEGGMVVTDNEDVYKRMVLYRNHGMGVRRYWHEVPGYNFRLTNLQAALGLAQLEKIESIHIRKKDVYECYCNLLKDVADVEMQLITKKIEPSVWATAVCINGNIDRDKVICRLNNLGIEARTGFYSANDLSHLYGDQTTPVSNFLSQNIICLPSSPRITFTQIKYVCSCLAETLTTSC